MSFGINVKGGTGGQRRRVRVLPDWTCECIAVPGIPCPYCDEGVDGVECCCFDPAYESVRRVQKGTAYSCGDCGARRPS